MLSPAQSGVVRGVVIAAVITAAATALHMHVVPALAATASSSSSSPAGRTRLWLKWNLPKALALAAHIARIGNHRFLTPADIGGAGQAQSTPQVRVLQALLQNTQEQVVLAVLAHGAFVALAPPDWLGLIPTYTVLFVAGRVLFAAGYAGGAAGRALGFALTFMPSMAMCVASLVMLLSDPL